MTVPSSGSEHTPTSSGVETTPPLDDVEQLLLNAGRIAGAALKQAWNPKTRMYHLNSDEIGNLLHALINEQSKALNSIRRAKRQWVRELDAEYRRGVNDVAEAEGLEGMS